MASSAKTDSQPNASFPPPHATTSRARQMVVLLPHLRRTYVLTHVCSKAYLHKHTHCSWLDSALYHTAEQEASQGSSPCFSFLPAHSNQAALTPAELKKHIQGQFLPRRGCRISLPSHYFCGLKRVKLLPAWPRLLQPPHSFFHSLEPGSELQLLTLEIKMRGIIMGVFCLSLQYSLIAKFQS